MTAPDLSPAEAEIVARFDAAPTLPEAYTPLSVSKATRRAVIDHLKERVEAYENEDWTVWDWAEVADELLALVELGRQESMTVTGPAGAVGVTA